MTDATQPSPQPADLERALAEIDRYYSGAISGGLEEAVLLHWPTIRAGLARERALRGALREFDAAVDNYVYNGKEGGSRERMDAAQVMAGARRKVKALLAHGIVRNSGLC